METMKKEWGKPLTGVQEFAPQEFIAACDNTGATQTYYFMCDGGISNQHYDVILDTNKNHTNDGYWVRNWNGSYTLNPGGDELLTYSTLYYHPCGTTHVVTVPYGTSVEAIFPYGWIQTKNSHSNTNWTPVRIWRGDDGNNIHCTTNLRSEDFIPHNPS
ncbi:MAG: hypothetical protein J6T82_02335 [Bacteroidaceae bacterium]|nr:hypothetical protein [Bacteroidaceae bacterium]